VKVLDWKISPNNKLDGIYGEAGVIYGVVVRGRRGVACGSLWIGRGRFL